MKKLLFAVVVLSVLAPFAGFAEPTSPNEIGLYTEPHGYGETGTYDVGTPVDVYLVLTRPVADGYSVSSIYVFACRLNFFPIGGIEMLSDDLGPGGPYNVGDADHIADGYLEYHVGGYINGCPVVDEAAVFVHFVFLNTNAFPVEVTLGPISDPYIPGRMYYITEDPDYQYWEIMRSVAGGSHGAPVFIFNGEAVAVEDESFGSVKALYR